MADDWGMLTEKFLVAIVGGAMLIAVALGFYYIIVTPLVAMAKDKKQATLRCSCGRDVNDALQLGREHCPRCGQSIVATASQMIQNEQAQKRPGRCLCGHDLTGAILTACTRCPACGRAIEETSIDDARAPLFECRCGYDLAGTIVAGRSACPECGHSFAE